MADWHGYFVVERENIGAGNWSALQVLFEDMGTHDSTMPAYNTHKRTRLDGNAVIYESMFDTSEITVDAFKQMLADEFGVLVGDISNTSSNVQYGDYDTLVLTFIYAALDRFVVRRFGAGGSTWGQSLNECIAYLILNKNEWEPVVV